MLASRGSFCLISGSEIAWCDFHSLRLPNLDSAILLLWSSWVVTSEASNLSLLLSTVHPVTSHWVLDPDWSLPLLPKLTHPPGWFSFFLGDPSNTLFCYLLLNDLYLSSSSSLQGHILEPVISRNCSESIILPAGRLDHSHDSPNSTTSGLSFTDSSTICLPASHSHPAYVQCSTISSTIFLKPKPHALCSLHPPGGTGRPGQIQPPTSSCACVWSSGVSWENDTFM